MAFSPAIMRRLMRELTELRKNPPEGIRVQTSEEDMLDLTGIIEGPEGTPYAGGYFKVKFKFTEEFPTTPPKCWMTTKIFHPNVSGSGEICVNTLKKDWKSEYGIVHILTTVKCLLIYPNPDSALDEEAGKMLQENYDSYCERAKLITSVHAKPRTKPVEFETPSSESTTPTPTPSTSTSNIASKPSHPSRTPTSNLTSPNGLTIPAASCKAPSPAPQPLKSSAANLSVEKESLTTVDRHPSPSPLSTADSNVAKASVSLPPTDNSGPKAVKRAATGGALTGAEKRKKALKRL
ncbi:hypothetical protein BDN72DRAFT_840802 [Pluteus cervinus]|uniref:Uncharacterized protein n=1 Tax=Pluteus cervinus TaxID=181527 RepID=A0ACD3ATA5_9AGAR|nr:hypothetical protein BDN72DRAFT_840802 [Pluteus cervinus]